MHCAEVRLHNWLRYAGKSSVKLLPMTYGIVARHDSDAQRSNWMGKTAFLEAIRFALYGEHRKSREDDWITNGENEGGVEIVLSDGTVIHRFRKRGSSTQLHVDEAGIKATGDAAQAVIERKLGMSLIDFDNTCWFGQKRLSRFVTARPSERMEIIAGWVALESLQRCEANVRSRIASAVVREQTLNGEVSSIQRMLQDIIDKCANKSSPRESLVAAIAESEQRCNNREAELSEHETAQNKWMEWASRKMLRDEYSQCEAQGLALKDQIAKLAIVDMESVRADEQRTRDNETRIGNELKRLSVVVKGQFDGKCPVAGVLCRQRDEINESSAELRSAQLKVMSEYDEACRQSALARFAVSDAIDIEKRRTEMQAQLNMLRVRARAIRQQLVEVGDEPPYSENEHNVAKAAVKAANAANVLAQRDLVEYDRLTARLIAQQDALHRVREHLSVLRVALQIMGRRGAQRVVAERALARIESDANALLRESGIDLAVTISWAKEGSGLASTCEQCGNPFGSSAKVKACERCGAPRGNKLIERLDVELSDQSGAAEDLVGAALQLAAAAWLRNERGITWSAALIDEPFGSLDAANRMAFSQHLMTMLRGRYGFEQAFVVAHHSDVMAAMPAMVSISADEYQSRLEKAS